MATTPRVVGRLENRIIHGYGGFIEPANLRRYVSGGGTLIVVQRAAVISNDEVLGEDVDFDGWAEHTNGATLRARWDIKANGEDESAT